MEQLRYRVRFYEDDDGEDERGNMIVITKWMFFSLDENKYVEPREITSKLGIDSYWKLMENCDRWEDHTLELFKETPESEWDYVIDEK